MKNQNLNILPTTPDQLLNLMDMKTACQLAILIKRATLIAKEMKVEVKVNLVTQIHPLRTLQIKIMKDKLETKNKLVKKTKERNSLEWLSWKNNLLLDKSKIT